MIPKFRKATEQNLSDQDSPAKFGETRQGSFTFKNRKRKNLFQNLPYSLFGNIIVNFRYMPKK